MREADDNLLQKSQVCVDSGETTLDHIGELKIPLASGVISREHVLADFYDFAARARPRRNHADITLVKNGGGAYLDLVVANDTQRQLGIA